MSRIYQQTGRGRVGGLLTLVLFAIFAVCVLMVLLLGANAYQGLTERDRQSWDARTCAQYITTKAHKAPGEVTVTDFDDVPALLITEEIEGEVYQTRVYCYDGWLRELFSDGAAELLPADGERVLQAEALALSLKDGLLTAEITPPSGEVCVVNINLEK